jgi:hypothetical protein
MTLQTPYLELALDIGVIEHEIRYKRAMQTERHVGWHQQLVQGAAADVPRVEYDEVAFLLSAVPQEGEQVAVVLRGVRT